MFVFFVGRYVELKSGILKQAELEEARNSVVNLSKLIINSHAKNHVSNSDNNSSRNASKDSATDVGGSAHGNTFNPMAQKQDTTV